VETTLVLAVEVVASRVVMQELTHLTMHCLVVVAVVEVA
jgi:hypothetical protein